MKYILDTCCVSELFKPAPEPKVADWVIRQDQQALFLSVVTLGEIQKGIARLPASERTGRLSGLFNRFLEDFSERILTLDRDTMLRWGSLVGRLDADGSRPPVLDSLIAATALTQGMEVVTRNVKDLERCGVRVVNPWSE